MKSRLGLVRYIFIFVLLISTFSLASISQQGVGWEFPVSLMAVGNKIRVGMLVMYGCEAIAFYMDRISYHQAPVLTRVIYWGVIALSLLAFLFCLSNGMINLTWYAPLLSSILRHSLYWGFPRHLVYADT